MHPAYVFGCNDEAPDFSPELHARIMQSVSYTPAVTLSAADAQYDDGKTSRANWRQLTGLAMTLAAIVLIAFCSPWRPFTFDSQFPPQAAAPAVPVSAQAILIRGYQHRGTPGRGLLGSIVDCHFVGYRPDCDDGSRAGGPGTTLGIME